jgi:two-component system chemotaxis sensor kinase CheA
VDDLTKEFLAESQEGLDRMERCLTELELRPDDTRLVDEIFRAVHTIKGTTGFLGFERLEKLAHAGEHLLGSLRDGRLAVSSDLISGLLKLMDGLRAILGLVEETGVEGTRSGDEDSELIAELALLNGAMAPEEIGPELLQAVVDAGEAVESPISGQEGSKVPAVSSVPLVSAGNHERNGGGSDKTLRIDVDVLNRMMNLVGELVLTRNQLLQSDKAAGNFPELARRLDSVTADLRETVMQARMQPMGNLFGRFPRMVRDLARTCGRNVRLEFSGQETGLDKSLLEAIKDPLTHAVRNAVDHGIETPTERVLSGKRAEGCVLLKAFQQSGSVVVEVRDDGAGIPIERVREKAIERGLVTMEQAAGMSEREILQLIFLPGFSTAAAVTTVSGRGVGMDVVRANVEKVGGSVEVESRRGEGTTLRLRVPLTLAIVPSLIVRSAGQYFALPQNALVELVDVPQREFTEVVKQIGSTELYCLRERLLPMVRLDHLLGLEENSPEQSLKTAKNLSIAVLEADGCRYGLVVDELMSPEEIVVKPLSPVLREKGLFSGATVLGNGTLALILDVVAVAARAGVKATEDQSSKSDSDDVATQTGEPFLIFEDRAREQTALPLDVVERIESVAADRIEYVEGRPLLQYRGALLSLKDDGGVLAEVEASRQRGDQPTVTVLICRKGRQNAGIVVRQVLDVVNARAVEPDAMSDKTETEIAVVHERLTRVDRQFETNVSERVEAA